MESIRFPTFGLSVSLSFTVRKYSGSNPESMGAGSGRSAFSVQPVANKSIAAMQPVENRILCMVFISFLFFLRAAKPANMMLLNFFDYRLCRKHHGGIIASQCRAGRSRQQCWDQILHYCQCYTSGTPNI